MRGAGHPVRAARARRPGARLFPSFGADELAFLLHEPEAGVLRAQRAIQALAAPRGRARRDAGPRAGGARTATASRLDDGRALEARRGRVGVRRLARRGSSPSRSRSASTRQELFFFDGGPAWARTACRRASTTTARSTARGDLDGLGVKVAPDFDGPPLAPDAELPPATDGDERSSRAFLARALPRARRRAARRLQDVPLRALARLALRRRPAPRARRRVWLLGGGSGHGFKHGPAMAERVAAALRGGAPLPAQFALGPRDTLAGMFRTAGATG